jgi:biopolymer transport protein ExbB
MQNYVDLGETAIFFIMGIASVLALAVFVERVIVFRKSIASQTKEFLDQFTLLLRKKDLSEAKNLAEEAPDHVYKRFAEFTLERYAENPSGVPEFMQGKMAEEKLILETRLPILNTLGNNAPFIGLLGTVLGVIKAFYNLGTLGNTGSEVVMRSISTALLATAAGLAIAIPVVMANNYFSRKIKIIMGNLEILSHEVIGNLLHGSGKGKH